MTKERENIKTLADQGQSSPTPVQEVARVNLGWGDVSQCLGPLLIKSVTVLVDIS